jgi:predicted nucleotidyltransferase
MINQDQIKLINSTLQKFAPEQIGLFGSRVRGDERLNSDLDILMSFKDGKSPYSLLELLAVEKALEDKLGFRVEIVNEHSIKNDTLKHRIFADLQIVYRQQGMIL